MSFMDVKYRVVRVPSINEYQWRVQERRPLWASFFIPFWEFVSPYRWHPSFEHAMRDMESRRSGHSASVLEVARYDAGSSQ